MSYAFKNGNGNKYSCGYDYAHKEWVVQVNEEQPFRSADYDTAINYLEKRRSELKEEK